MPPDATHTAAGSATPLAVVRIERPLSPHLQAYRLPWTAWLSITHRFTGVLLSAGLVVLALIPVAAASGPDAYRPLHELLSSAIGKAVLWLWLFAFALHLVHGVRHLLWDGGLGYAKSGLNRGATFEVAAAVLLTASAWIFARLLG